jgi:hypothetical protein
MNATDALKLGVAIAADPEPIAPPPPAVLKKTEPPKPVVASKPTPAPPPLSKRRDVFAMSDDKALAGLTRTNCAASCDASGCVITGGACAHPLKTGIQRADKTPAALARYGSACKMISANNIHELAT